MKTKINTAPAGTPYETTIEADWGEPVAAEMQKPTGNGTALFDFPVAVFANGKRFATRYIVGRSGLVRQWVLDCGAFGFVPFARYCDDRKIVNPFRK